MSLRIGISSESSRKHMCRLVVVRVTERAYTNVVLATVPIELDV